MKQIRHITLEINPLEVVGLWDRNESIKAMAASYVNHGYAHSTMTEAAEQAALDLKDDSVKMEFKRAVRRLQKGGANDQY